MTRSALLRFIRLMPADLLSALAGTAPAAVDTVRSAALYHAATAPPGEIEPLSSLRDACTFVSDRVNVYTIINEKEEPICRAVS